MHIHISHAPMTCYGQCHNYLFIPSKVSASSLKPVIVRTGDQDSTKILTRSRQLRSKHVKAPSNSCCCCSFLKGTIRWEIYLVRAQSCGASSLPSYSSSSGRGEKRTTPRMHPATKSCLSDVCLIALSPDEWERGWKGPGIAT